MRVVGVPDDAVGSHSTPSAVSSGRSQSEPRSRAAAHRTATLRRPLAAGDRFRSNAGSGIDEDQRGFALLHVSGQPLQAAAVPACAAARPRGRSVCRDSPHPPPLAPLHTASSAPRRSTSRCVLRAASGNRIRRTASRRFARRRPSCACARDTTRMDRISSYSTGSPRSKNGITNSSDPHVKTMPRKISLVD